MVMDTVVLDGVRYIKVSQAAKEFKYTTDYIGQLCRAGKVDAQLIGRTWFVNPESIKMHKSNKHKRKNNKEKVSADATIKRGVRKTKKVVVPPVISSKTVKAIRDSFHNTELLQKKHAGKRTLRVSYELDDESLLPTLHKKQFKPPKKIKIEPVGAKRVSVKGEKKATRFSPTAVPEVALSGEVRVSEIPDNLPTENAVKNTENKRKDNKNKDISATEIKNKKGDQSTFTDKLHKLEVGVKNPNYDNSLLLKQDKEAAKKIDANKQTGKEIVLQSMEVKSENENLRIKTTEEAKKYSQATTADRHIGESFGFRLLPLWATLAAVLISAIIFTASGKVSVTGNSYSTQTIFSFSNLSEIISRKGF